MKKILSVFCTIMLICAILTGCTTTSSDQIAVTNNDLYNYDFSVAEIEGRWYWKDVNQDNAGVIDYLIFDVSGNQVKSWTINGHYETADYRYPVYDSTTYNEPIVYTIEYEDDLCYLKNTNGNDAYVLSKSKYGNNLIADNGNKTYNFVFDYDDSFESTLEYIYN